MEQEKVLKKNKNFYCGVIFTVLEGLLSGSNFMVLYAVMQMLYRNEIRINTLLTLTGVLAGIYFLRLFVYSFGYMQGQIGGAKVSKNIRLHLGDKIKKIPLFRGWRSSGGSPHPSFRQGGISTFSLSRYFHWLSDGDCGKGNPGLYERLFCGSL